MKRRIRIIGLGAVVLAIMLMALPLTGSAVAAATAPTTPAVPNATEGTLKITKTGSTFDIYMLAEATVEPGASAYTYVATSAFENFFSDTGSYPLTAGGVGSLIPNDTAQDMATALQGYIGDTISPDYAGIASDATTNLPVGYYLIIEKTTSNTSATVASKAMLVSIPELSGETWNLDVHATLKDSEGDIEKHIVKSTDPEVLVDASTAAIGDTVPYKIVASVPDYDDSIDRDTIVYKVSDALSEGLTYQPDSLVVKQGTLTLQAGMDYKVATPAGKTFELTFDFEAIEDKGAITITFNAILNENAAQSVGTVMGNPNDVTLTYTNNPLEENDYFEKDDRVISYTTGIAVQKVAANDAALDLAGATFELWDAGNALVGSYTYDTEGNPVLAGSAVTDGDGMIYFPGLDEGTYTLKETVAPAGYHILDNPVTIELVAEKDGNGEPTGEFTCKVGGVLNSETVHPSTDANKLFFNVEIKNEAGWSLPGTGGIGTTLFTVGGAALIALSGILLVIAIRKRSAKTK